MLLETHNFEFEGFFLDTKEKVLLYDGKPVSITPKSYQLLSVLVENHGCLVEKDKLMKEVWADSFVEDGNLAFTIKLLRNALGDDSHNPRFIQTVPRRGYRFIARVKKLEAENETVDIEKLPPENTETGLDKYGFRPYFKTIVFSLILLFTFIGIGIWYVRSVRSSNEIAILAAPFSSEKLSTNGKVGIAVITPDGQNVIYRNIGGDGRQSIWLRQRETGSNIQIIPPSDDFYFGLTISADGKWLFLIRRPIKEERQADIYRVSIFGGVPVKIVEDVQGWTSVSPDGRQISFVRCPYRDDEFCSLWVADTDSGANQRQIATRSRPFRISDNRISPDGKTIAFAVGQSENAANEFGLMAVDLENGAESELTKEKFFNIKSLAWLPDGNGWLVTASKTPNRNFLIWHISVDSDKAEPLTKDSETYASLSLDSKAQTLVSTQVKQDLRLQLFQFADPAASRFLVNASLARFTVDGKIIFSSQMSGNEEIWSIDEDGSNQRQLTNNTADETAPIVSPDNGFVYFSSNRTGAAHIWRMNADGSNQTQLTHKDGGFPLSVSPDGEWVYYHHGLDRTLWRIATKTGEEQIIFSQPKFRFAVSPDASRFAIIEKDGDKRALSIISIPDGTVIKKFRPLESKTRPLDIAWMPDGKSLLYISSNNIFEDSVLWKQHLDEEAPKKIALFSSGEMNESLSLAVSPNGKTFTVIQGKWLHDAVLLKGLR